MVLSIEPSILLLEYSYILIYRTQNLISLFLYRNIIQGYIRILLYYNTKKFQANYK